MTKNGPIRSDGTSAIYEPSFYHPCCEISDREKWFDVSYYIANSHKEKMAKEVPATPLPLHFKTPKERTWFVEEWRITRDMLASRDLDRELKHKSPIRVPREYQNVTSKVRSLSRLNDRPGRLKTFLETNENKPRTPIYSPGEVIKKQVTLSSRSREQKTKQTNVTSDANSPGKSTPIVRKNRVAANVIWQQPSEEGIASSKKSERPSTSTIRSNSLTTTSPLAVATKKAKPRNTQTASTVVGSMDRHSYDYRDTIGSSMRPSLGYFDASAPISPPLQNNDALSVPLNPSSPPPPIISTYNSSHSPDLLPAAPSSFSNNFHNEDEDALTTRRGDILPLLPSTRNSIPEEGDFRDIKDINEMKRDEIRMVLSNFDDQEGTLFSRNFSQQPDVLSLTNSDWHDVETIQNIERIQQMVEQKAREALLKNEMDLSQIHNSVRSWATPEGEEKRGIARLSKTAAIEKTDYQFHEFDITQRRRIEGVVKLHLTLNRALRRALLGGFKKWKRREDNIIDEEKREKGTSDLEKRRDEAVKEEAQSGNIATSSGKRNRLSGLIKHMTVSRQKEQLKKENYSRELNSSEQKQTVSTFTVIGKSDKTRVEAVKEKKNKDEGSQLGGSGISKSNPYQSARDSNRSSMGKSIAMIERLESVENKARDIMERLSLRQENAILATLSQVDDDILSR